MVFKNQPVFFLQRVLKHPQIPSKQLNWMLFIEYNFFSFSFSMIFLKVICCIVDIFLNPIEKWKRGIDYFYRCEVPACFCYMNSLWQNQCLYPQPISTRSCLNSIDVARKSSSTTQHNNIWITILITIIVIIIAYY